MYIKQVVKYNKGSNKTYLYLHLVESVRTPKGLRQRLVLNLGAIDIPKAEYKEFAQCIERLLSGQAQLFTADAQIEKLAPKAA